MKDTEDRKEVAPYSQIAKGVAEWCRKLQCVAKDSCRLQRVVACYSMPCISTSSIGLSDIAVCCNALNWVASGADNVVSEIDICPIMSRWVETYYIVPRHTIICHSTPKGNTWDMRYKSFAKRIKIKTGVLDITPTGVIGIIFTGIIDASVIGTSLTGFMDTSSLDKRGSDKRRCDKRGNNERVSDERKSDKRGSDERGSDKRGSDKRGSDERGSYERESDKRGRDERGSDKRGSDERGSDERGSDERGSDERKRNEQGRDERGSDERGSDEQGNNERESDEPRSDEPGSDERESNDRGRDERGSDDKERRCNLLLGIAVYCIMWGKPMGVSASQCAAACCYALLCVAVCGDVLQLGASVDCNVLCQWMLQQKKKIKTRT